MQCDNVVEQTNMICHHLFLQAILVAMHEWCLSQVILWLWMMAGQRMLLTTFRQCREVNSCFGLCLRPISINIHAEGKFSSYSPGLLIRFPEQMLPSPRHTLYSTSLLSHHHENYNIFLHLEKHIGSSYFLWCLVTPPQLIKFIQVGIHQYVNWDTVRLT